MIFMPKEQTSLPDAVCNAFSILHERSERRVSRDVHCLLMINPPLLPVVGRYRNDRKSYQCLLDIMNETDDDFDPAAVESCECVTCLQKRPRRPPSELPSRKQVLNVAALMMILILDDGDPMLSERHASLAAIAPTEEQRRNHKMFSSFFDVVERHAQSMGFEIVEERNE